LVNPVSHGENPRKGTALSKSTKREVSRAGKRMGYLISYRWGKPAKVTRGGRREVGEIKKKNEPKKLVHTVVRKIRGPEKSFSERRRAKPNRGKFVGGETGERRNRK